MGQQSLDQWNEEGGSDDSTPGGRAPKTGLRSDVKSYKHYLADNADPFADDSCPWCCAPAHQFTQKLSSGDSWGCKNCSASIPVDADWYQRGEKIIL